MGDASRKFPPATQPHRTWMMNQKTSQQLEVCWRVLEASSTRILACSISNASGEGVELRVGYVGDVPLHSQVVSDRASARVLAQRWLGAVRVASRPLRDLLQGLTVFPDAT